MHIFISKNYISFITFSILFYQYQAFESNVKSDDFESLNLFQNDLSSKNIIKYDSIISSLNRNKETNYLQKRQASLKSAQEKSKKIPTRKPLQSKITTRKKPFPRKTTPRKTTYRKITPRKTSQKPLMQKTTHKAPPKNKITTKPIKKPKVTTTEKPDVLKKFLKKTIDDINKLRAKFKRKALEVDNKLVMEAQKYSDNFASFKPELDHNKQEGQLRYICPIIYIDIFDAVKQWTSNNSNKIIDNSGEKFQYPEFGQLIAKKSTKIGCGISENRAFIVIFCKIQPTFNLNDKDYEEEVKNSSN
uniref:SCP domain-containing protein n=1 Tax=Strongyloides venezuelensis TaxID=75913 RepID=A0A0K0FS35_STRVS